MWTDGKRLGTHTAHDTLLVESAVIEREWTSLRAQSIRRLPGSLTIDGLSGLPVQRPLTTLGRTRLEFRLPMISAADPDARRRRVRVGVFRG